MTLRSRVTILVKASPQPSKKHQETVCCAGLTESGEWKRLFPIRFRRLSGSQSFSRWDIVNFEYDSPRDDNRAESCRVREETIELDGRVKNSLEKSSLIERSLVESEKEAVANGHSLAAIRPKNVSLSWQQLSPSQIEDDREKFKTEAAQLSLLEEEIAAYEPCPYKFKMSYDDGSGAHTKTCADWETTAAFFNLRMKMEEKAVLEHLQKTYCDDYVAKGLVLTLGNMKKRPQTWQLLGIFPVIPAIQKDLF